MNRLLCTCGKSYDVASRSAGTLVRCRACETVLTVPAPRAHDPARYASERLRRARGAPCPRHPRVLAADPCERCQRWMCGECRAAPPSSHLCRECAPAVGATRAMPLDFGLVATPEIAARLLWRSLPWVFVFNLLAHGVELALLGLVLVATRFVPAGAAASPRPPAELATVIALMTVAALVVSLFEVVLIPAADVVIFDRVLRDYGPSAEGLPPTFGAMLGSAAHRAWEHKGALVVAYLLILAAMFGSVLVLLPFVLAWYLTGEPLAVFFGIVVALPVAGATLGSFGLSIPATILEHRSAPQAFGRAWNLARLRPWASTAFGIVFVVLGVLVSYRNEQLEMRWGLLPALAVTFFADMAWPALLVAAYHGLVAEEAKLVGRRS